MDSLDETGRASLALLQKQLGPRLLLAPTETEAYRQDTWVLALLRDRQGRGLPAPAAVALPNATAEVVKVVEFCRSNRVPLIPRGGGSGVVGGVASSSDALVLSTENLTGLRSLSELDHVAVFGAGTNGMDAELMLQAQGFTTGHWPQSITLSSVGGWVATRASGQLSTAYGNIEDIVISVTAVLADGSVIETADTPRAASGPDLLALLMGSEGTLGVITEVALQIRPLPAERHSMYVHFDSFSAGIHGIRQIVQADVLPPVVRLYDSVETQRNFGADTPDGRCGLILVFEGSAERVAVDLQAATKILDSVEATVANPDVAQNWFDNKSHAPSAAPFLEKDIVVDTIEVAAPWSRIEEVYDRVIDAVDAIPEVLAVSGHSSHSYRTGTNIYFSFGVRCDDSADLESAYDEVWQATMRATLAAGGGISHHHGIGRVRRPYLRAELGEAGHRMLTDIKHVLDPEGLFNPGVLI